MKRTPTSIVDDPNVNAVWTFHIGCVVYIEVVMMIQEDEDKDEDKKNDRKEKNKKKLVMHQHQQCQTPNDRRIKQLTTIFS